MTRKDLFTTAGWAVATLGATLIVGLPNMLDAGPVAQQAVEIRQPKCVRDGCEMTVRWLDADGKPTTPSREPGQKPVLELVVTNTTDHAVSTPWSLRMTAQAPVSPFQRALPTPRQVWTQAGILDLDAGQTKIVRLETGTPLAAGRLISVIGQLRAPDAAHPAVAFLSWDVSSGTPQAARGSAVEPQVLAVKP